MEKNKGGQAIWLETALVRYRVIVSYCCTKFGFLTTYTEATLFPDAIAVPLSGDTENV